MAMLEINGVEVPAPSSMKLTLFDVGSTQTRNAAGGVVVDRLGVKRRLDLKWNYLDAADLETLMEQMGTDIFFSVLYPDAQDGMRQMECYCSEKSAGVLRMRNGVPEWIDVQMCWTER